MIPLFDKSPKVLQTVLSRPNGFTYRRLLCALREHKRSMQPVGSHSGIYGTILLREHFRSYDVFLAGTSTVGTVQERGLYPGFTGIIPPCLRPSDLLQVLYASDCRSSSNVFILSFGKVEFEMEFVSGML